MRHPYITKTQTGMALAAITLFVLGVGAGLYLILDLIGSLL